MKHLTTQFVLDTRHIEFGYINEKEIRFLYLFYNPATKLTKIGITNAPRKRLRKLECASGCELYNIITIELEVEYDPTAKYIEGYLHEFFADKNTVGEWFNLSIRDIIQIQNFLWYIEGDMIWDNIKHYFLKDKNKHPKIKI